MGADYHSEESISKRAFRNGFISTFILMGIWAIVLELISEGWWVLVINIVGVLLTAWWFLWTAISFFKLYVPTIISVFLSIGLWVGMFVVIRFIISLIL